MQPPSRGCNQNSNGSSHPDEPAPPPLRKLYLYGTFWRQITGFELKRRYDLSKAWADDREIVSLGNFEYRRLVCALVRKIFF
jgi:hypothetical protein